VCSAGRTRRKKGDVKESQSPSYSWAPFRREEKPQHPGFRYKYVLLRRTARLVNAYTENISNRSETCWKGAEKGVIPGNDL